MDKAGGKMKITEIAVKELKPFERNAKKHDDKQIKNVMESIKQFGFAQPIVVDKDNVVIIGHCRLVAAKRLKMNKVPCLRMDDLNEDQVAKLRLLDNKLNESDWDMELLEVDIPELDFTDFDLDWELPNLGMDVSPDEFGDEFSLPDGDKPEICQMTFTLHSEQKALIEYAISVIGEDVSETFGNTNKNGNALYEVVKQWAEQRK